MFRQNLKVGRLKEKNAVILTAFIVYRTQTLYNDIILVIIFKTIT